MSLRLSAAALVLLGASALCLAQPKNPAPPPKPLPPAEGERLARELVAGLLAQKPTQDSSNIATVNIRGADGKRRRTGVRFEIVCTPANYSTIYETATSTNDPGGMRLTIVHSDDRPNRYLLSQRSEGRTPSPAAWTEPRELSPDQLMQPFAGSDFWFADLGLDFLHWPQQRVLRKEMRKGQACDVLESTNPHPVPGGYAKVISWIGANHPDETVLVHADAYDAEGKLLKEFDPKKLQKINGAYQLESMEMYNDTTGSRTVIEFNLQH